MSYLFDLIDMSSSSSMIVQKEYAARRKGILLLFLFFLLLFHLAALMGSFDTLRRAVHGAIHIGNSGEFYETYRTMKALVPSNLLYFKSYKFT